MSRNFAFSENKELKELQITELPGLKAEGENSQSSASQTQETSTKNSTQENPTEYIPKNAQPTDDQTRVLCTRTTKVNCGQMNNPGLHKPITWKQSNQEAPKIDSPSKEEWANPAAE